MKTLMAMMILLNSGLISAHEVAVNVREKKKVVQKSVTLETITPGIADSENFQVLKADGDEAVDLDTRAGTVMYHLKIARDYFTNVLGSEFVATHPKINVRIEMDRAFNENLHFLPEGKAGEYNNALTIPASGSKALDSVNKWGVEIWFRPMKKIEIDNPVYQTMDQIDRVDATGPVVERAITDLVSQAAVTGSLESVDYMGALSQVLFTVGALEVLPKVVKFATKNIKAEAYLDSALIPEVIYHEFAHVALADHISIRKSTSLNEGLANYFAAVINQNAKIAAKNGSASRNVTGYNGEKKEMYNPVIETKAGGQANFVFSYLWRVRTRLAKEFRDGDLLADRLIFESRKFITYGDQPVKSDLVSALRSAVEGSVPKSQVRKVRMLITEVTVASGM